MAFQYTSSNGQYKLSDTEFKEYYQIAVEYIEMYFSAQDIQVDFPELILFEGEDKNSIKIRISFYKRFTKRNKTDKNIIPSFDEFINLKPLKHLKTIALVSFSGQEPISYTELFSEQN